CQASCSSVCQQELNFSIGQDKYRSIPVSVDRCRSGVLPDRSEVISRTGGTWIVWSIHYVCSSSAQIVSIWQSDLYSGVIVAWRSASVCSETCGWYFGDYRQSGIIH